MMTARSAAQCALALLALAGCSPSEEGKYQGYVEADYVYMASSKAGRLERLAVLKGTNVEAGAVLFELEAEFERQALAAAREEQASAEALLADMATGKRPEEMAMAEAQLGQATADARYARSQHARNTELYRRNAISKKEFENSEAAARVAEQRVVELTRQLDVWNLPEREKKAESQAALVEAAKARVAQAEWDLDQKVVRCLRAGLVFDTLYREGEWVAAGSPVAQLLPPGNVKLRFFVPEAEAGSVRVGGPAFFDVDGLGRGLAATVSYVSPDVEYTPPVIYSNETRSKLVIMVEAVPAPETAAALHPGQPVAVRLP